MKAKFILTICSSDSENVIPQESLITLSNSCCQYVSVSSTRLPKIASQWSPAPLEGSSLFCIPTTSLCRNEWEAVQYIGLTLDWKSTTN